MITSNYIHLKCALFYPCTEKTSEAENCPVLSSSYKHTLLKMRHFFFHRFYPWVRGVKHPLANCHYLTCRRTARRTPVHPPERARTESLHFTAGTLNQSLEKLLFSLFHKEDMSSLKIHLNEHAPAIQWGNFLLIPGWLCPRVWTHCECVAQRVIGVFRKEPSSPQIRLH